jgi:hypothetical protein
VLLAHGLFLVKPNPDALREDIGSRQVAVVKALEVEAASFGCGIGILQLAGETT